MNKFCDLHTHSVFSDGTFTPSEIIVEAEKLGLCAVALCDHNTLSGVEEFVSAAKGKNVKAVAGIEFSSEYKNREIHILGLFVPEDKFGEIGDFVKVYKDRKEKSETELIDALLERGYKLDKEKIFEFAPNRNVNRVHIAKELIYNGYVSSINDAFELLLSKKRGLYVPPKMLEAKDVIKKIKSVGAIPVIAHPLKEFNAFELDEFLSEAKDWGLAGMECFHSEFTEEMTKTACELADKFRLLKSGGSDFHGEVKPGISLGIGRGNLRIPCEIYEKLKENL